MRGILLCVVALALVAVSVGLCLICLTGIGFLIVGLVSWLHPVDVASAWAHTLAGVGLIGGSTGTGALGWQALEKLRGPFGAAGKVSAQNGSESESALRRARKFVAVIGILLALVCLPFAAAIHASAHVPWLEWSDSPGGGA